jgi:hypothetical protein
MRLLPAADFLALTMDGRPHKMDTRGYEGHTFTCAVEPMCFMQIKSR